MKTIGRYCLKFIFPAPKIRRHIRKRSWSCLCLPGAIASWRHGVMAPGLCVEYGQILMKGEKYHGCQQED